MHDLAHGGRFDPFLSSVAHADEPTLLERFDALWSDRRYTRRVRLKEYPTQRIACRRFYEEANKLLAAIPNADLPSGVARNKDGAIGSSDIVRHVDAFRAILDAA